jgi:hypothetical protein
VRAQRSFFSAAANARWLVCIRNRNVFSHVANPHQLQLRHSSAWVTAGLFVDAKDHDFRVD